MMSLPLSFLPGPALAGSASSAGAMTQLPSTDLTEWQREMAHAVAQAGFQHPSFLHQYQHGQDDPDTGTQRIVKRPPEPEIVATPACPILPPLLPAALPKFAAMSALPEMVMPAAVHQKQACSSPAPPVRLHAEWAAQGVMVWLGADAAATPSTPQLTQQIKHWLGEHGVQLLGLVCNGKSLYSARNVSERKAPHGEAPPVLQDFTHAFHIQET